MKYPSTLLAQTGNPVDIQKADLDLLKKINEIAGGSILSLRQTGYNEKPNDSYDLIDVNCGANQQTVNLAPAQQVPLRSRTYGKNDSGAGELRLLCQGTDVIRYPGGTAMACYVGGQYQNVTLVAVSGGYVIAAGVVQPVPGEPSLGTPHPTSDANRSSTLVVSTSVCTAGVWSAAVTMTGAPTDAKAAYSLCKILIVAGNPFLSVEAASGYTLSDITVGSNAFKYHTGFAPVVSVAFLGILKIHLDANKQFRWCSSVTNATVQIGSAIDYDI